ncbi:MAG: hypothetical protein MHM6MM_002456 [Cercozoa sp. M6MM]
MSAQGSKQWRELAIGEVEQLLLALAQPDTKALRNATLELMSYFRDPRSTGPVAQLLAQSSNDTTRWLAAIYLRRLVSRHWSALSKQPEMVAQLRQLAQQRLVQEQHEPLRRAVAGVVHALLQVALPLGQWHEVLALMSEHATSKNVVDRRIALLLWRNLVQTSGQHLQQLQLEQLQGLFASRLQDESEDVSVQSECLRAIGALMHYWPMERVASFRTVVPTMMAVCQRRLNAGDADAAVVVLDVLGELAKHTSAVLAPYMSDIVHFMLQLMAARNLDMELRSKAGGFLGFLLRHQSNTLLKKAETAHQVMSALFSTAFAVLNEPYNDDDFSDDDAVPGGLAIRLLGDLADYMSSEVVFTPIVQHLLPIARGDSGATPLVRANSLLALSVCVEGLATDFFERPEALDATMKVILGCADAGQPQRVRTAAADALQEMVTHIVPDALTFTPQIVQVLVHFMRDGMASLESENGRSLVNTACAVLEMMAQCEMRDEVPELAAMDPHVPSFAQTALQLISRGYQGGPDLLSQATTMWAISMLGALFKRYGKALDDSLLQTTVQALGAVMSLPAPTDKEDASDERDVTLDARGSAIAAMGNVALGVGGARFQPFLEASVKTALHTLEHVTDDFNRRSACEFFSVLAELCGEQLPALLKSIPGLCEAAGVPPSVQHSDGGFVQRLLLSAHSIVSDESATNVVRDDGFGNAGLQELGDPDVDSDEEADEDTAGDALEYEITYANLSLKTTAIALVSDLVMHAPQFMAATANGTLMDMALMLFAAEATGNHEDLRDAAANGVMQTLLAAVRVAQQQNALPRCSDNEDRCWSVGQSPEQQLQAFSKAPEKVQQWVTLCINTALQAVCVEDTREVASTWFTGLSLMVLKLGAPVLSAEGHLGVLMRQLQLYFELRGASQWDEDEIHDDGHADASQHKVNQDPETAPLDSSRLGLLAHHHDTVLDDALELLTNVAAVFGPAFAAPFASQMLSRLMALLQAAALSATRSQVIGALAQCLTSASCINQLGLDDSALLQRVPAPVQQLAQQLYEVSVQCIQHSLSQNSRDEMRPLTNSLFLASASVFAGGAAFAVAQAPQLAPLVKKALEQSMSLRGQGVPDLIDAKGSAIVDDKFLQCRDNAVSCAAYLWRAAVSAGNVQSLTQLLPLDWLLNELYVIVDMEELPGVLTCLMQLLQKHSNLILPNHAAAVIRLLAGVLVLPFAPESQKNIARAALDQLTKQVPAAAQAMQQLPQSWHAKLRGQ